MALTDFLHKHRQSDAPLANLFKDGVSELESKINQTQSAPPQHLPDQRDLIQDLFDTDEQVWMLFLDAGRYDICDQLVWDYFDGHLQRAWNGGVGYTGDWAVRNLQGDFGDRGLFTQLPLRYLEGVDYDGRDHFKIAPDYNSQQDVQARLAALGYTDGLDEMWEITPTAVNRAVEQDKHNVNGGVVRYLKPHPPFAGFEQLTSESTKTTETQAALDAGEISYQQLTDAYIETYRIGLEAAVEFVESVSGKVILTADHGTCLTCGQLFHGRQLDKHDHLCVVPWMEVDRIV